MNIPKLQPTTILGIGGLVGVVAGAVAQVLTGHMEIAVAAGISVAGLVHVVLPDNSDEPNAVEKLVQDAVQAAITRNFVGALPQLLTDGLAVVNGLQKPAPVPAPQPAPVAPAPAQPAQP